MQLGSVHSREQVERSDTLYFGPGRRLMACIEACKAEVVRRVGEGAEEGVEEALEEMLQDEGVVAILEVTVRERVGRRR